MVNIYVSTTSIFAMKTKKNENENPSYVLTYYSMLCILKFDYITKPIVELFITSFKIGEEEFSFHFVSFSLFVSCSNFDKSLDDDDEKTNIGL